MERFRARWNDMESLMGRVGVRVDTTKMQSEKTRKRKCSPRENDIAVWGKTRKRNCCPVASDDVFTGETVKESKDDVVGLNLDMKL